MGGLGEAAARARTAQRPARLRETRAHRPAARRQVTGGRASSPVCQAQLVKKQLKTTTKTKTKAIESGQRGSQVPAIY